MNKQLYYGQFKDINNIDISIEIYKNTNDNISSKELILSSEPLIIEYSSDNIFQPTKLSSATINVLTKDILIDLYTSKTNEISCKVFKNDSLFWFGFLSPNIYSTDYTDEVNILTLQFIDTLSQLEYIKYSPIDTIDNNITIASFKDIIFSILNKIDNEKTINNIYLSNSIQLFNKNDIFNNIYSNERNFFDEENEPETAKTVLQEIAKYLSMTIIQWGDSYYFIDYDSIGNNNNKFIRYNRTTSTVSEVNLNINTINVNKSIYESNGSISLNDTYNKITVVANSNQISSVLPDAIGNEKDIINQNEDNNKYYTKVERINNEDHTLLTAYFKSKSNWEYQKPYYLDTTTTEWKEVEEITDNNVDNSTSGVYWQKVEYYKNADGEPSSIDWKTYLTMVGKGVLYNFFPSYLKLKNKELNIFKGGYFIVNLKYKMSRHLKAHSILTTSDEKYTNSKFGSGFLNTMIPCRLSIGDKYFYNGDEWVSYSDYQLKVGRDYFKVVSPPVTWEGSMWYRHIDQYGYQRFTTKSVWDALPASSNKTSGGYADRNKMHYFTDSDNNEIKIFCTEEFYHECKLKDRFYLVHKNKVDEKVFDEDKTLTNTVSYKMNLVDSEDGVAIKLPPHVLVGEVSFELDEPNQLGRYPMYLTTGNVNPCYAFHFSDLKLQYKTQDTVQDIFNMIEYESDIKYTNTINEEYVNEYEDMELYINTYNNQASSYSYVITKNDNDNFDYIYSTYNRNTNKTLKQEEHIINKLHNYYSTPKFVYENSIILDNVKPYSKFYENTLNKNFILNSCSIDIQNNSITTNLNEITN